MLPQPDYKPAVRTQPAEVALVAGAVGAEFVAPEFGELVFPCRQPPAVPEISIHEHGDFFFRENDVRAAGQGADVAAEF